MAISEEINLTSEIKSDIAPNDKLSTADAASLASILSTLEGIRGELQSALETSSPEQRAELSSQLSILYGSIASLKTGNKTGISTAIASASGVVNHSRDKISEEKQQELGAAVASYNNSVQPVSMSSADYDFFTSTANENFTWYTSSNLSVKQFVATDLAFQFSKDFDLKTGFTAARVVSENTTLSNIKDTNIKENLAAIADAKNRVPLIAQTNPELAKQLSKAIEENEKLIQSRNKVHDYTFKAQWDKITADGNITADDVKTLTSLQKNEAARRKEDFKEIDTKVLNMFSEGEKTRITKIYSSINGDKTPTAGEMQQFLTKYEPDAKNVNHYVAVMNKHASPQELEKLSPKERKEKIEAALQMMSPEVRKDGLIAMYQSRMQAAEMAYDIKEMMKNLNPEQQKERIAIIQQMLKEGKKEEVIDMLETANGDKNLSQGIKEWINKSKGTEDLQEIVGSVLQADNNPRAIRNFATELSSVFAPENPGFFIPNFYEPDKSAYSYRFDKQTQSLPKFEATSSPNKFADMLDGANFKAPEGVVQFANSNTNTPATNGMNKAGINKQPTMSLV